MSTSTLTPEELTAARGWLEDCAWGDLEPSEVAALSDSEVIRGISRHYCGGVPQFRLDCVPRAMEGGR